MAITITKDTVLPIGSVVNVTIRVGAEERKGLLVICGTLPIHPKTKEVYDYCGVVYPMGAFQDDDVVLFSKEQINEVVFEGYKDNRVVKIRKAEEDTRWSVYQKALQAIIDKNNGSDN